MKAVQRIRGPSHERLLSFHLHRHVAGVRKGRSLSRIHASDVTKEDWCPRLHALLVATKTPPPDEFISTSVALSYDVSGACARVVTRWATECSIAIGDWLCARCSHVIVYGPQPAQCPKCKAERFWYQEHRFQSQQSGISGGIDLIVVLPGLAQHRIVEIKAYDKDAFKGIKLPLVEHRQRTSLYLRLIDESDDPACEKIDTTRAILLYLSKGGWGVKSSDPREWGLKDMAWTPFKEFTVRRDDKLTDSLTDRATPLWQWMNDEGPMPDGICPSAFGSVAQRCPLVKRCFSGEF